MIIEEDINMGLNLNYFTQKNGYIEYIFPKKERNLQQYGFHIDEEEKKMFHTNNFNAIIQSKENVVS